MPAGLPDDNDDAVKHNFQPLVSIFKRILIICMQPSLGKVIVPAPHFGFVLYTFSANLISIR